MLENCLARTVITHFIHSFGLLLKRKNISGVSSSITLPLPHSQNVLSVDPVRDHMPHLKTTKLQRWQQERNTIFQLDNHQAV